MPQPEHQRTFKAEREFTDRDEPRSLFRASLDKPQPLVYAERGNAVYRVLVFYGVGGQGKSALFKHFDATLAKLAKVRKKEGWQRLAHAALDLEQGELGRFLNPAEALLKLRLDLKQRGNFPCPHFDVAFSRYFAMSRPGANIREAHPELFRSQNELVNDAVSIAGDVFGEIPDDLLNDVVEIAGDMLHDIPGWGFLHKYGDRMRIKGVEWWERRGLGLLRDLDGKSQSKLLRALPLYLGADLTRAQERNEKLRLVVLLDTYEALWRDTAQRGTSYLVDDWVRSLVENAPRVLFTFCGRDKLRWDETDPEWREILDQHRLGGLSDEDADRFLRRAGIEEAEVRRVIVTTSKGGAQGEHPACLPYYLDLQLGQYEKDRNDQRLPRAENYGGSHREITERFLKPPCTDRAALQTLLVATCARTLTPELYEQLTRAFLGPTALPLRDLASYSFINDQGGQLVVHALMREYLQAKLADENPRHFDEVHGWLFAHYDAQAQPEAVTKITLQHERALREAAFHKEQLDRQGFAEWCLTRCVVFRDAARYTLTSELYLRAWKVNEALLSEEHPHTLASMSSLAFNLSAQGEYIAAQQLNEQVLMVRRRVLGEEHPNTLSSMKDLALNLAAQGEYKVAQHLSEQALTVSRCVLGEEHPDTLTNMSNLARVRRDQGAVDEALDMFKNVVEKSTKVSGSRHPHTLRYRYHLAATLLASGQKNVRPAAVELHAEALEVLGATHPWTKEIKVLLDSISG